MEKSLLLINLATVCTSVVLTSISIMLGSLNFVLYSMVACIALRAIASEHLLNCKLDASYNHLIFEEALGTLVFLIASSSLGFATAFITTLVLLIVHTVINRKMIKNAIALIFELIKA